ncbi:DUF4783 domain-containing protein [Echinicola jeungdonensis]|uniref:DUF4783 domain-containing protein n=1 Tax=Echinicola jeungdonensis TaxID=709343 RepID=A0ABV5J2V6_9BACT|nr:DUF4783 domain-containing protein [Echinicola jeungdonensis]MDN3668991.1 DUF4783 domain-containing protein [Echinicola jeungdonensis]
MNKIYKYILFTLFFGLFLYLPDSSLGQGQPVEEISLSIKAGSSKALSSYFGENVELSINGNQGDYSKNQAELVIRDFFKKFPPSNFDIVHKGKSSNQIQYFIGSYQSKEIQFRLLIKCKLNKESPRIYALDINKE